MGNSSGVVAKLIMGKKRDRTDPSTSPLISDKVEAATEILQICTSVREIFALYFLEGSWINAFAEDSEKFEWNIHYTCDGLLSREVVHASFKERKLGSSFSRLFQSSSQDYMCSVLLACAFRYFLHSKPLASWLLDEGSGKLKSSFCPPDDEKTVATRSSQEGNVLFSAESSNKGDVPLTTHRISSIHFQRTLQNHVQECNLDHILSLLMNMQSPHLRNLLNFVLHLPYAVSVAQVSPTFYYRSKTVGQHFPIAYVNNAYEELTQFPNSDLEGFAINCLFDATVAGESAVDAFENSLEEMKPIQTLMKMERRSGEVVDTWLATCPVYNSSMT
eukprot:gene31527-40594_t